VRPFYWSVRRELWENRSIGWAPLLVAAVALVGSLVGVLVQAHRVQDLPQLPAALLVKPFALAPAPIMLTAFLVGVFYSLDALYGERRDRSVLFWKSMPVSDRTTVLAKASLPLVVLPSIAFALSVATVAVLLLLATALLPVMGANPTPLWRDLRLAQMPVVMLYGLVAHTLWWAPLYGWLLLVSAWARRLPLLWAALPPIVLMALEGLAFGTSRLAGVLRYRLTGAMSEAFAAPAPAGDSEPIHWLSDLTPARFLSLPGLWVGLALTAVFLALAVRLRRNREAS
jgi:ABC-2 type transport system permease protein